MPERCLAIAVASAGAGDDVRQAQIAAGETDVDKLIFWQLKLSHHRLSIRAAKGQPFLLGFGLRCGTTQQCQEHYRGKTLCASDFHRLRDTIHAFKLHPKLTEIDSNEHGPPSGNA